MVALGGINEWQPTHGPVTTWMVSPAAREAARNARRNGLAASFQRAQHLRAAYDGKAKGMQLPRLMVVAWEIAGVCDIAAMTAAISAHVRRHDSYHDWFEFENDVIVRRTIDNPEVIDFVPVKFGQMDAEQIRKHALATTPETLQWGWLYIRHRPAHWILHLLRQCRPSLHRRHVRRRDLFRYPPGVRRSAAAPPSTAARSDSSRLRRSRAIAATLRGSTKGWRA